MAGIKFDSATTSLVSAMITHAENEVNKYLSKRYDIDSFASDVPPLVTSLTEQLAEGYSHLRIGRGGKESLARGKELIKMAQENLQLIADYKADLVDSDGDVISDSENTAYRVLSNTDDYSSTFNEDDPLNWEVDQDKLDDIEDERDS